MTDPQPRNTSVLPRSWLLFLVLLVLVVSNLLIRRWGGLEEGLQHPAVGRSLSELTLYPLRGDAPMPEANVELEGQIVLVNFWGTWCFPCRLELPHLAEMYERWRDDARVRFLFVSCEDQLALPELAQKTLDFLEREGFDLPVYADPGQASRRHVANIAALGDGFSYPTTIILDAQQRIRGLWRGFHEEDTAEQAKLLESLLHGQ